MNKNLHILNSQLVFSFRRNLEMRKRIFEFEDHLKNEFKVPFRSVAIPDEIDPNIPRFESQSIHEHSRIQVSQNRVTVATNFDELYKNDYKLVKEYLLNKCILTSKLIESENMQFVAYIMELGIYMDEEKINSFIKNNTGTFAIKDDCKDFSLLYSKKYKSDFYLNIKCSKFAEQELILSNETQTIRPTDNLKHGISIVLDINTKPLFESNKNFESTLYNKINTEVFDIIGYKNIETFLKGDI